MNWFQLFQELPPTVLGRITVAPWEEDSFIISQSACTICWSSLVIKIVSDWFARLRCVCFKASTSYLIPCFPFPHQYRLKCWLKIMERRKVAGSFFHIPAFFCKCWWHRKEEGNWRLFLWLPHDWSETSTLMVITLSMKLRSIVKASTCPSDGGFTPLPA